MASRIPLGFIHRIEYHVTTKITGQNISVPIICPICSPSFGIINATFPPPITIAKINSTAHIVNALYIIKPRAHAGRDHDVGAPVHRVRVSIDAPGCGPPLGAARDASGASRLSDAAEVLLDVAEQAQVNELLDGHRRRVGEDRSAPRKLIVR